MFYLKNQLLLLAKIGQLKESITEINLNIQ